MSDLPTPPAPKARVTGGDAVDAPSAATDPTDQARDLVFVGGRTNDGAFRVVRSRDERLEIGEMRAPKEGQPLMGELVQLRPTEDHEQLFECETLVEAPIRSSAGPPKVSSDAYRSGWDQIFGDRDGEDPSALN